MIDQHKETKDGVEDQPLTARQLYQHDPLLVLLKDRWHLSTVWICVGTILLPGSVFLGWWLGWVRMNSTWIVSDTLSILIQTLILFPVIFLIYLRIPGSIASLFNTLKANGVIGEPRKQVSGSKTYEAFVQQMVRWMDNVGWTLAIVLLVACYALYRLLILEPASSSPVPYWMRVCAIVSYWPLMYVTGMSVLRILLALIFTNWLFYRFSLQVRPLHPDGAGGLGAMGNLLWMSVGIMLWEALLLVASVLSRNLIWLSLSEMILLGAIYIALTPALLIGWLLFPHAMMVKARDEMLRPLTDAYQQAFLQSLSSHEYDTRSLVSATRRLTALKQRYDLVHDAFPVWPLETGTLSRIAVTVILPLLLPILTSLITLALHPLGL
ncbi:MAG: hypothetical protein H0U76_15555 [Ktedonobacteraceae bacterium]|nr:hypothetical protein [Ktedonobacteraceae bacterium]